MSSDGSVDSTSSRLRQFGLYRSIDARTEEFLRLSRRRQLRQGFACAAISTAVTVTIVICVIFVYEFIVISERSKNMSRKWHNLMNSSSDPQIFDPNLNDKMRRDSSTIKLLPILLKSLRENVYRNKIREDFNVNSDVTESYTKNIFSVSRNRVKMSSPRHHINDYNTSPFSYLKKPGRDIDDYKKISQTGDYKKIMKFLDKPFEFSLPVIKSRANLVADKKQPNNKTSAANKKTIESNRNVNTTRYCDCKCKNVMSKFLNQIIKCLKKSISEFQEAYNHIRATDNITSKSIISPTTSKIIKNPNNLIEKTSTIRYFKINSASPQNIPRKEKIYRNEPLLSILNVLRPKMFNLNTKEVNVSDTAPKPLILLPAVNKAANVSKKLFIKHINMKTTTELYKPTEKSQGEHILKNNKKSFSYIFYNTSQDNEMRGKDLTKNISNDDILELAERNSKHKAQYLKGETKNKIENQVPYLKKFVRNNTPKYKKPNLSTPSIKLLSTSILQKPYKKTDRLTILKPKNTDSTSPNIHIEDNLSTIFNSIDQITDFDWSLEEDDIEKVGIDKIYKGVENATKVSYSRIYNKKREHLYASNLDVGLSNVADDNHSRQLIHAARPSYLEIRRNAWKKEETNDYENN